MTRIVALSLLGGCLWFCAPPATVHAQKDQESPKLEPENGSKEDAKGEAANEPGEQSVLSVLSYVVIGALFLYLAATAGWVWRAQSGPSRDVQRAGSGGLFVKVIVIAIIVGLLRDYLKARGADGYLSYVVAGPCVVGLLIGLASYEPHGPGPA